MRKFIRFAVCALAVLCTGALWADIQIDNVAALSGLTVDGGTYNFVQFRVNDDRFAVAADYATDTTVTLLLGDKVCDGTEGNGPAAVALADTQLKALELKREAGEKWFAVP